MTTYDTRYIFLDIDGVLNTHASCQKPWVNLPKARDITRAKFGFSDLDLTSIENLNRITDITGAKIVISSTWRLGSEAAFNDLVAYLIFRGVTGHIVGRTPSLRWQHSDIKRGHEIDAFLDGKVPYENVVILDDDSDMVHLIDRLVKTNMTEGLTKAHAQQAIELFGFKANLNLNLE